MSDTAKRTKRATVRFNPIEAQALEAIADLKARSPSETLRELVRREARELGVWPQASRQAQGG